MVEKLLNLDRRWIYLLMAIAVLIPLLLKVTFPERATPMVQAAFDTIEGPRSGLTVGIAFDYDPASAGELEPMAEAVVHHCCQRGHKLLFLTLWPTGAPLIDRKIETIIGRHYPQYQYGRDMVNLGYKPGSEGVIKNAINDLPGLYLTDTRQNSLAAMPVTQNLKSLADVDVMVNIGAGYPGPKEWIQYFATKTGKPVVVGCTGVSAPGMYPYFPVQLRGLLGAIKGAAEYEAAIAARYPELGETVAEARTRMGPQLLAHVLIVGLIVAGNVLYFLQRRLKVRL